MRLPADEVLSRAQASLARAIGRARAGEDRELAQKVREQGESLAHALGGLLKMSRVHAADNRAFDAPVEQLSRVLRELGDLLGPVRLVTVDEEVYVNDVRIRSEGKGSAKDLGAELARHNAGGVTFHAALPAGAVRALVAAFAAKPADAMPRRALQQALFDRDLPSVELAPRFRYRVQGEEFGVRPDPLETLRRTLRILEEAFEGLAAGRVLNPLPLRKVVVQLLDFGVETPELWESLGQGSPQASHAATVALVSLLVGKAAGFGPAFLQDLGLAALIHDVGYVALTPEAAGGPEGLARHPAEGARIMLRQRGFHPAKLRRLRAVLDHHRDDVEPRGRPSVLGQVLRLAEDYATLLRVYADRISPCDALGAMSAAAGRAYNPVLAQVMVNALGRYPPGTLLELDDGRYARSVSPVRSPQTFATPLVRIYDLRTRALSAERHDLARGGAVRRSLPG
jgi:HD domain